MLNIKTRKIVSERGQKQTIVKFLPKGERIEEEKGYLYDFLASHYQGIQMHFVSDFITALLQ